MGVVSEQKLDRYRERRAAVGGSPSRALIEALVDAGSFVELDTFAAGPAGPDGPGQAAGVVAGFGEVEGRPVAVCGLDAEAGRGEAAGLKVVKLQELALRNRVPIVAIHGEGALDPGPGVAGLAGASGALAGAARASGVVPQINVLLGPTSRATDLSAALGDLTIALATGADGAGSADVERRSEREFLDSVRMLLGFLPASGAGRPPERPGGDDPGRRLPELQAPADRRDCREIARAILDGGELIELRSRHAPGIVTGLGRLDGLVVGVVASQPAVEGGALDGAGATKAAGFVRFCDAFNVPLVTLVDSPGSGAVAPSPEQAGALLYAYAEATVPMLAVITGRCFGDTHSLLSPGGAGCDLTLAWPGALISAAGAEGAADVYGAAERGLVDEVIEPMDTRRELVRALRLCQGKAVERPARKHGNPPS
jgi:propionyl-CoA carboxylase beta chain